MPLRFQIGSLNTIWVPLSLLYHASFILILILILTRSSITEAEGLAFPAAEKPMRIGVPWWTFSEQFVKIEQYTNNPDEKIYSGFCIDVFKEVVKTLSYDLPYKFEWFNGSYDGLVDRVAEGTFDAAVGDITILAERWKKVEFTAPFTESGMSLVTSVKPRAPDGWKFLIPFTTELWVATWAILMYTMFIVWLLEHRSNPEFCGPWKDQLGSVLWFTFTSLFGTQRERIEHNYTRVVVVVWLFVVLIVTQSYTASFSSMLTVSRLDPNVDSLKRSNAVVGFYGNDVVKDYLVNVLHFNRKNIKDNYGNESQYLDSLNSGTISAAFLETPYAKSIANQYCDELRVTGTTYKFGGFGFVFQYGSGIATNVSKAIQTLMEDGIMKKLEDEYFPPCSDFQSVENKDRLCLQDFWGLYIFYLAVSTICLLLFLVHLLNYQRHSLEAQKVNITRTHASAWKKVLPITQFLGNAASRGRGRAPSSGHGPNYIEMR